MPKTLKPLIPAGMTMPEMALRFILGNDDVHTIIPGMRKIRNVEANMAVSDGKRLAADLYSKLKDHRWDRHTNRMVTIISGQPTTYRLR